MKRRIFRLTGLLIVLSMVMCLLPTGSTEAASKKTITILGTSDVHGRLTAYDYATDTPADGGLVKVATLIKEQRAIDKDAVLIDCGDITQGNMVSEFRHNKIHPAIKALNALNYDAWELGNHEFNFEFKTLKRNIKNFNGHVLGANIYKSNGERFVEPYFIKTIKGVKVAFFGIEAPHITIWESNASHYNNMTFTTPEEEIEKVLKELETEKPDVIVGIVHYGEEGEYELVGHGMYELAAKYSDRVDAFFIGHAHSTFAKYYVNGEWTDEYSKKASTVMIETGTNAENLGKITIDVKKSNGKYKVVSRKVENLSAVNAKPDADFAKVVKRLHKKCVKMANTVVGQVTENFYDDPFMLPGIPYSVIEDGPVLDLIHRVQLQVTGADVSCAALFNADANLLKGDFKLKDGVNVYKYDNTLMAVKCTGKQLKAIMEQQAGNFFNSYQKGDLTISFNPNMRMSNYDTFQGVDYEIDISKPEGKRIVNVTYKGKPLKDKQKLVLALNNYRFSNLCNDGYLDRDNLIYDSAATGDFAAVRDMIAQYVKENGSVSPQTDNNWRITGYDFSDPAAQTVYQMIRDGKILIPSSADGRTTNVEAVNVNKLRAEGIIK